jgi:hypothetical protein
MQYAPPPEIHALLQSRLQLAEDTLLLNEDISPALCFANALMCEVIDPLEAINNLIYITKLLPDDRERVQIYMKMAEAHVERLNQIARKALGFCREQSLPSVIVTPA